MKFVVWLPVMGVYVFLVGPMMLAAWWMRDVKSPGLDFAQYRDRIVVFDTATHFTRVLGTNMISTVGYVRNDSGHSWKDLQLEVQHFDSAGSLVDTKTETLRYQELPAGLTEAFRIRDTAAAEASAYASHKVFVRNANDARKGLLAAD